MNNIELSPKETLLAVIDPQKGFVDNDGSFAEAFGAEKLVRIQSAIEKTRQFIDELPEEVRVVFVRSEYQRNQFPDQKGLTELCVPGANHDCDWSDRIRPPANTRVITKNSNDACESLEWIDTIRESIKEGVRQVIVAGCTTTTCVEQTILSTLNKFPELRFRIYAPLDTMGARLNQYGVSSEERSYEAEDGSRVSETIMKIWDADGSTPNSIDQIIFSK